MRDTLIARPLHAIVRRGYEGVNQAISSFPPLALLAFGLMRHAGISRLRTKSLVE
jgi:hypothetical protein